LRHLTFAYTHLEAAARHPAALRVSGLTESYTLEESSKLHKSLLLQ
jgi:hypothetical protein